MDAGVTALFVYGTLLPGHLRWPMLADRSLGHVAASAPGTLWDTGNGWPAACFGEGDAVVPGALVHVEPSGLDVLLPVLDEIEGIGDPPDAARDPYVRVVVEAGGVRAWAYHATRVDPTWRRIPAWADQPER